MSEMLPTLSLATEEIFHAHSQKWPVANIPVVDFRSQPREILLPKLLFVFLFSFSSRKFERRFR